MIQLFRIHFTKQWSRVLMFYLSHYEIKAEYKNLLKWPICLVSWSKGLYNKTQLLPYKNT